MERLSKLYSENKGKFAMANGFALGTTAAMYFYRRRQMLPIKHFKWQDKHFKSENLALYSYEAEIRAAQI